ncbi:MAG: DUF1570 domain-containing protein [Planctomycetaceae bacterium]|nr:DUF1570 domain-containing protein [Planctomycetaceae bacterium]
MRTSWWPYVLAALSALTCQAAETDSIVEARDGKTVTTGKLLAQDNQRAIMLDRVGGLHDLSLGSVTLKPTTSRFQSLPTTELRNQLSREFGKGFEIGTTRHYVVLAPSGRAADYAAIFEEQYSTLQRYFRTRNFSLTEPQFPMVAVVFATQKQFIEYANRDGSKVMANMQGYYSPRTNRVALFEPAGKSVAVSALDRFSASRPSVFGAIKTDLKDTMIHEATHQVAYNIGLHSRVGETPRWVVEGMATVFEAEGMRTAAAGNLPKQRLNWERYVVFQNFVQTKRLQPKSLRSFIESDHLYESAVLDFYAQSWALTFFLVETRPRNYSAYLKRIAARDPFAEYPAKERLADFKETIHADVDWLDTQFVKYIEGVK